MRIIYKIKSSWDFISSQILIYLKRRWNSKMAISIKNHEDRITALENYKIGKNSVYNCECNGNWNNSSKNPFAKLVMEQQSSFVKLNKDTGDIHINSGAYLIQAAYGFSIPDNPNINEGVSGNLDLKLDGSSLYVPSKGWVADYNTCYTMLWYVLDIPKTSVLKFQAWLSGRFAGSVENDMFKLMILKLYYNFSYNITREFYKVKFKLKHYLCSHLRNYASNKGGVIQNGY